MWLRQWSKFARDEIGLQSGECICLAKRRVKTGFVGVGGEAGVFPADKWHGGILRRWSYMSKDAPNWPRLLPATAPSPLLPISVNKTSSLPHPTITTSCSRWKHRGLPCLLLPAHPHTWSCWFYIPHISQIHCLSLSIPPSLHLSLYL